ncbi:MAG: hypothetical protein RI929_242 [Actinomycetota bacterium]
MSNLRIKKRGLSSALAIALTTLSLVFWNPAASNASNFVVDDANAFGVQTINIGASPSAASGTGAIGTPLVYPTSISIGVQVSWVFTAPANVTSCSIGGGSTILHPYGNFTTSAAANTCTLTGSPTSDSTQGELIINLAWGSSSAIFQVAFQREYSYGSFPISTSATINTTNGFAIGSTVSVNANPVWRNSYLNTLGANSFTYYAFLTNGKCGESSNGSSRIYLPGNSDFNWGGNGFQIPQSATNSQNVFIPDLTGYGLALIVSYNGNNTMFNQLTTYKIGESSLVVCTHPMMGGGGGGGGGPFIGGSPRPSNTAKYSGPEILSVDVLRPIVSGGKLTFTGKNLSAVTSATIGDKPAALSLDASNGLNVTTPAGLAPGKHDLVMQSSFGKLTHINAVTIKAPTPTQTTGFKGQGEYLNEAQVAELVAFNASLNADYEKVRCIVNAADAEVAKALAIRVCAHVARGEARNVEVIQDVRSTYQGSGFWVRVYAKG